MWNTPAHTHTHKMPTTSSENHQQFIITDPPKDHEHESKSREHSTFEYFSWVNHSIEIHHCSMVFLWFFQWVASCLRAIHVGISEAGVTVMELPRAKHRSAAS